MFQRITLCFGVIPFEIHDVSRTKMYAQYCKSSNPPHPIAALTLARSFSVSLFNCPQAARMSRPRGVRTGLA